jgi:hypothetical protein
MMASAPAAARARAVRIIVVSSGASPTTPIRKRSYEMPSGFAGAHLVLPPDTLIHYGNHSCDPTMWHVGPY